MRIRHNTEWPGRVPPHQGRWDKLMKIAEDLDVNGDAIEVEMDDEKDLERARSTLFRVVGKEKSEAQGWKYQTTIQDGKLYIRKVSLR